MRKKKFFLQALSWTAMAAVLSALIASVAITNITLRSVEKNLPNTLLSELQDLSLILSDIKDVAFAAEMTKVRPTSENFARLRSMADALYNHVKKLRDTYVFDNLVQASAFHAVVAPAIADLKIWLFEGVSGYGPETETTLDIVLDRISEAFRKCRDLNDASQIKAQNILSEQRGKLDRFLRFANLLFILTLVITLIMCVLLIRQHVLQRRGNAARSELRRTEKSLQESVELYSKLIAAIPDIVIRTDLSGRMRFFNDVALRVSGYEKSEIDGKNVLMFIAHEDRERATQNMRLRLQKRLGPKTYHFIMKNGKKVLFEVDGDVLRKQDGTPYGSVIVCRDITERKRVEEALRRRESMLKSIFRAAPTGIGMVTDRVITMANERLCDMTGYSLEELFGRSARIFYPTDEDFEYVGQEKYRQISISGTGTVETKWVQKNGEVIDVLLSSTPLNPDDLSAGVIFTVLDITARKKAMAEIHTEKEKFRLLVEGSPLGIAYIDDRGLYRYVNPKFTEMFGYSLDDIPTGREWIKRAFPNDSYRREIVSMWMNDQKTVPLGEVLPRKATVTCKNGTEKIINFRPVNMISGDQIMTFEDITAEKRLEAKLHQAQKMESIGTLAGGIAHDFNNLLMGIQGRTSLMSLDLEPAHPQWEHVNAIEEYIRSAADLTRQLLAFAREGKYEVKPIDMNELVQNSSAMFGRTKKEIQIHIHCQQAPLVVQADRVQIEQVLLNLYVNAWQAMPDGGDLYLKTRIVTLDDQFCKSHQAAPGRYVNVTVTDTGIGMDDATRRQIFDPFFSTKEKSRGTGLGLASAYGIIKNHGGMVTVCSQVGQGSTFDVFLPSTNKEAFHEVSLEGGMVMGSELILLVDDEEIIIDIGRAMLEALGYRVITARSGQDAVDLVSRMGKEIDLVILDMIMPGMDGSKTFDRIREIQCGMAVLLSSGYAVSDQADEIMRRGCSGFIQKPFNINEFSKKVRKVLDNEKNR